MDQFTRLAATAIPLGAENVDTDQLIPARFMSRPRSSGYGQFLLHDLRFAPDGSSRSHMLDQKAFASAAIMVARRNFGTGSSREAAVYALWDFGIRCVIAPSFGDIFASNAVKNGLLPAQVSESDAEALLSDLGMMSHGAILVDLEEQLIHCEANRYPFSIDPVRRMQLMNGWDDLDLTLQHQGEIDAFRAQHHQRNPWSVPMKRQIKNN